MKAAIYRHYKGDIEIESLPDPKASDGAVVLAVKATGICRSDWHGWMGHDPDIELPHVPGHELAGEIVEVGRGVTRWRVGDRVTVPFVGGCGRCPECLSGNQQVCDFQFQPGFTHWGSFAERVEIGYADNNLVGLPDSIDDQTAAGLGCRFITSFRAVVDQGRVKGGEWVAVHGCGGVGLSAIMIAAAHGAQVIAIDINPDALAFARSIGATEVIDSRHVDRLPEAVKEMTKGGAHLSLDALGHPTTCFNSIANLRKRGRHVQIGLVPNDPTAIPMAQVIAHELEILGSHGMQAHRYPDMLAMIEQGSLQPNRLIHQSVDLQTGVQFLTEMDQFKHAGITIIDQF